MKKVLLPALFIGAGLAVAVVLVKSQRTLEPRPQVTPPVSVRVVTADPAPVRLTVHAQGTVSPRSEADLVPEVSGNVVWMSPSLVSGGYFEAGETLLRIDDRDYRADVARAEVGVERTAADLDLARSEIARARDLFDRELISQADLDSRQRTLRVAEAASRDAELVLDAARRDLDRTEIIAPFSGLVRSEQVDVGQFVSRGSAIARIYATDYLEVRLPLADRDLAYLNIPLGYRGEFDPELAPDVHLSADFAGQDQSWSASLVRTEAEIDPGTRMVYAIARIDADALGSDVDAAPPVGLFVQAEIAGLALDDIVVLPRSALRDSDEVLVIDGDNRLWRRPVDVLRIYRDQAYVSGGLNRGDLVSVLTLQTVVEGMSVQPLED